MLKIHISNVSETSRVHIFAQQFVPNAPDSLRSVMEKAVSSDIAVTKFPFAVWKNMFESDSKIGDEIKYVFDRQRKPNKMGNTLDRPTFLMKPNFV